MRRDEIGQSGKTVLGPGILLPLLAGAPARAADDLDVLVETYVRLGLPMSPDDAMLVRIRDGSSRHADATEDQRYRLGFLAPARPGGKATLYVGVDTDTHEFYLSQCEPTSRDEVALDRVETRWRGPVFETDTALATAIQCKVRGWDLLAGALVERSASSTYDWHRSGMRRGIEVTPRVALHATALTHWRNVIVTPESDWSRVLPRLRRLVAEEPDLAQTSHHALIESMAASLEPRASPPGSVEAMIDDLVDARPEDYWTLRQLFEYRERVRARAVAFLRAMERGDVERPGE